MFVKLKMHELLFICFGVLLLLLIIVAGLGFSKMASINDNTKYISGKVYTNINVSNRIIKGSLRAGRIARSAVLYNNAADIERSIAEIEKEKNTNSELYAQLEHSVTSVQGRQMLATIRDSRSLLSADWPVLFSLVRANNDAAASDFITKTFTPHNNTYINQLEDFNSFEEGLMSKGREKAAADYERAVWEMGTVALVALAAGIVMAWMVSRGIAGLLSQASSKAVRIASGNLAAEHSMVPVDVSQRNELSALVGTLEGMREQLVNTMHQIKDNATYVADSAQQLSSMSELVAASTQRQAESTTHSAATLEQLTVSITHVADSANDAATEVGQTGALAKERSSRGQVVVDQINQVMGSVSRTSDEMAMLTKEVQQIGNIVTVIRDVADQTNLLALNASIEAARAGESGRGFAVVADEVRLLAERTTKSVVEISQMISSIQRNAEQVVGSMSQSTESVNAIMDVATHNIQAMNQMSDGAENTMRAVSTINNALGEQRQASQGLAREMELVSQMAEQNTATVEELATTSQQLMNLSHSLQGAVGYFRF